MAKILGPEIAEAKKQNVAPKPKISNPAITFERQNKTFPTKAHSNRCNETLRMSPFIFTRYLVRNKILIFNEKKNELKKKRVLYTFFSVDTTQAVSVQTGS